MEPDATRSNEQAKAPPRRARAPARRRAGLFGVALVFASAGCRQLVGFHDDPGPEDRDAGIGAEVGADVSIDVEAAADEGIGAEAGGYRTTIGRWAFIDRACGECIDTSCAMTATDCADDPSCHAYEACVGGCADNKCVSQCLSRVPSAILSPVRPLLHCVATSCRTACPSSVLSLPNGETCGPVFNKIECTSCCCPELKACDDDPNCARQSACARQCSNALSVDQSCFEACTGRHPDPIAPTVNIALCAEGPCQSSCAVEDWRCLGLVVLPPPSHGPRKLYGSLVRRDDGVALGRGFTVKMCPQLDAVRVLDSQDAPGLDPCPMPFDEASSDETGNVVLDLDRNPLGVSSYFEVIPPPEQSYLKTHFFLAEWTLTHSRHYAFLLAALNSLSRLRSSDPGFGTVGFETYDCRQVLNRVPGVVVSASPTGDGPTYFAPGFVPDRSLTSTSSLGLGDISNLPAGQAKLTTLRQATQQPIGTTLIVIQPDTETIVELVPTP